MQEGQWTSQLLDISQQAFPSSGDNKWGILKWLEEGTSDETLAYVRVDIMNGANNTVLKGNLAGVDMINQISQRFSKSINLAQYSALNTADIRVKFKLFRIGSDKEPKVSNIQLDTANKW